MTATAISSLRFHNAVEIHLLTGIHHSGPHPGDDPVLGNRTVRHQLRFLQSAFLLH